MSALRNEAEAELDALFPPDRLRAGRHEIMRRLQHVGRAARVLTFPGQLVSGPIAAASRRATNRWVAAAAVAGVVIGVAVGMFFDESAGYRWNAGPLAPARQANGGTRPTHLTPATSLAGPRASFSPDDDFMSDLEASLDRPRTRELLPFDALTPHVREVRDVR
jgi:hypothetical protein